MCVCVCLHFPGVDPSQLTGLSLLLLQESNVIMKEEQNHTPATERSLQSLLARSDNERCWDKHSRSGGHKHSCT